MRLAEFSILEERPLKHVFISYSRTDIIVMQRIAQTLRENELKVWTDEKLTPGIADWQSSIQKAIDSAGGVIALLSPDAKTSEWVGRELTYAQMRKLIILPVLLRGDPLNSLPFQVVNSQWLDMRDDKGYAQGITKLTQTLKALLGNTGKSKFELIHEELKSLAENIAQIVSVGLVSVDGLTMGFYSRSPNAEQDRLASMSAASLSLGERITSELGAGQWAFAVTAGDNATIFQMTVGDEAVLIAIIEGLPSIDQTLPLLKVACEKLMQLT
jgi:predicted regulator of Ras-like GTPase activity (Roadblock/LC7/MglB family)